MKWEMAALTRIVVSKLDFFELEESREKIKGGTVKVAGKVYGAIWTNPRVWSLSVI